MFMNNIKKAVAKNIAELRIANNMTQLELAGRLNYSDKAVSKWEHGDSIPDLCVLAEIAEMFGVTLDYLIKEEHTESEKPTTQKPYRYRRSIIMLVSIGAVWVLAMLAFVLSSLIFVEAKYQWLSFVYAVPATMVVWLVLNSVWFNQKSNYFIISLFMWTVLASVHVTFYLVGNNIWLIYLLGIPAQVVIFLWSFMKKRNK